MERKANDISEAKELIAETLILIKKLKGDIASHEAEIEQLKKDIAQNEAAVKEAQDIRTKENKEYAAERAESELLSVVAGVKTALKHQVVADSVSEKDMEVVK